MKESLKRKLIAIFLFLFFLGTSIGLGLHFWLNPNFQQERLPQRLFWIHPLFMNDSLAVLENTPEKIDIISPCWYYLLENGSIGENYKDNPLELKILYQIIDLCQKNQIEIHPLIGSMNATLLHQFMSNSTLQSNFINSLLNLFGNFSFHGINIDFEGIPAEDQSHVVNFFSCLQSAFPSNRTLSIDVPAKVIDSAYGWGGWCDYARLDDFVDFMMIMTYDYHGYWSAPGEIAPTSWVKSVLAYATRSIALEKIFIGIPQYGYDWSEEPHGNDFGESYAHYQALYATYGGTLTRTSDGHELKLQYVDGDGYKHIVYYCDATTTLRKEEFLSRYPIEGYCYWHLTSGDPLHFTI